MVNSIRIAGLADVPAIARITREGQQPPGVEPEVLTRTARLLLTHVAFEYGALWVEQLDDGSIVGAVTAIPAGQLPPPPAVLRNIASQLGGSAPGGAEALLGRALLCELRLGEPSWLLLEISQASAHRTGDPALLLAALAWTAAQPDPAPGPVMVLADSDPERAAAQAAGFVERRTWGRRWTRWLGVATSEPSTDGVEPLGALDLQFDLDTVGSGTG
ncbi:hypothetical protein [Pengzhenrongella sp.]|jgi:hypothetical protein|uniref:hypothetical protein n=1 Tax=Pengzhenrongella sp. TaxID=2888820 RepID=UPI002F92EFB3